MKIYIASSWKNQHAVEMLTFLLREQGHEILSFIENNFGENPDSSKNTKEKKFDFESWVNSDKANQSFAYDTEGAMFSDLVIYISPSGKDAAAECGMAYANGVPIIGLYAKGEDFGLMRKMMSGWFERFTDVLEFLDRTKCTCPTECDCEKPPKLISNECPVHNENPYAAEDCPIHGVNQ